LRSAIGPNRFHEPRAKKEVENQSKAEKERKKQKKEIRQVMWVVRSGRTRGQLSLKQILKSLRTKKQKTDKKGGKERERKEKEMERRN